MEQNEKMDFKAGTLLLVNKPLEWTSFQVVNKIRHALRKALGVKKIKVGHAGTLDPLATGLLIICTGKFTKKLGDLQGLTKEYTGTVTLGGTTPSFDLESEVDAIFPTDHITETELQSTAEQFLGDSEQMPPIFSAIKVNGQPVYKKARAGKTVELKPRPIHIYEFDLTAVDMPKVDFRVLTSKGTYIRSLANDYGQALNSGGHLSKLCRTKIGEYHLDNAWKLEELIDHINNNYTTD